MFQAATFFNTLYWVLLCFFTLASTAILVVTLFNVVRLKNVRLQWNGGKLGGYPLFSTLYLLFLGSISFIAYEKANTAQLDIMIIYAIFGITWFYTSYFMSKYYITDYGILKNVNDPSQTIAWHQVRDFVEIEKQDKSQFTFFYMVSDSPYQNKPSKIVRLDIDIPYKYLRSFRRIVSYKLGRQFNYYYQMPDVELRNEYRS